MEALQLGGVDELDTIPSDDESYSSNDDTLFDDTGRQVRVTFAGMKRIEAFCSPIRASSHSKKKFKVA